MLVDSHVHVASSDEQRYPRHPTGAGSTWGQHARGVEELLVHLDTSEVDRAVVVQAVGIYGFDCRYAADVTAGRDRLALVGAIDMAGPDVGASVERLSSTTELAGLRLFGVDSEGAGWLTDGAGSTIWNLASRTGCVLVPTIFGDALPALRQRMEQCPDVDVALDHCAFPDLGGPDAMAPLLGLADLTRLHLKVTSHNLDTDGDPLVFLDALVEAFGPERVCLGVRPPATPDQDLPRDARHRPPCRPEPQRYRPGVVPRRERLAAVVAPCRLTHRSTGPPCSTSRPDLPTNAGTRT